MTRREELIRNGLRLWVRNGFRGILNYVTGAGKSFAGILAVEEFIRVYPEEPILIVCPTIDVIENFKREFIKFNRKRLLKHCKFICYASIRKEDGNKYSLVVLDEIHHITTDNKMPFFEKVNARGILGLSASLTEQQLEQLNPFTPIVDTLTLKDVGEEDFIADFTVINYPVTLTTKERELYNEYTNAIDYAYAMYNSTSWKKIGQRSRLVYSASNKLVACKQISELFDDKYGIVFSLTKDFAEKVSDILGEECIAIHSGFTKKQRAKRLKIFSDGRTKVRRVSVPKIFDEGVTLPRLSFGILLARYSKEKQWIQTIGRLLRKDFADKHSIIIRVYVRGTVEEKWVKESQKGFNVINVNTYEQLKSTIQSINC
jgi:superfamily II DNA or RNA helicase